MNFALTLCVRYFFRHLRAHLEFRLRDVRFPGGFLFFSSCFSSAFVWAILITTTILRSLDGLLLKSLRHLDLRTLWESALCASSSQSTHEHWACRFHGKPVLPGYPGLDQNLLGFVLCQSLVLLIVHSTIALCLLLTDSLVHSRSGAKTVWVYPFRISPSFLTKMETEMISSQMETGLSVFTTE